MPDSVNTKLKWICVENDSLITFAEVKRLVIYPMLLAQFVGIVHEIKPRFLRPPPLLGFDRYHHLPPALMALGHFSGNAAAIVRAYKGRGILICVAENFDVRIAAHRKGACQSPLYWNDDAVEPALPLLPQSHLRKCDATSDASAVGPWRAMTLNRIMRHAATYEHERRCRARIYASAS